MKGIYKGAPAKGGPAPGSWGDRYIIEKEEYHGTSMSCNKCVHYCSDDKSCSIEPVYFISIILLEPNVFICTFSLFSFFK